jgi:glyoxylase-like metal-dependent hydrolase (beta-lactamase superfamily II)
MPELGKLNSEYQDKGFQIVGIVADSSDSAGVPVPDMVSTAKEIVRQTGADYEHILASTDLNKLLLNDVSGVPTTINLVVDDGKLAVIDTGIESSARDLILPYLDRIGREPTDIVAIVNTHGHGDHLGSNLALREISGAPVMIHELDAPLLLKEHRWGGLPFLADPADRKLRDGEVIRVGSREIEVVALHGHSSGAIGLFLRQERVLFSGDALQGLGTAVAPLAFYQDPDAYVQSVELALQLGVEHLLMAHPYYPATDTHVHGQDVRRFLEKSLEFVLGLDALLLDVLEREREAKDAVEVANLVCARYGRGETNGMSTATVAAHLERLASRGAIRATATGGGATAYGS